MVILYMVEKKDHNKYKVRISDLMSEKWKKWQDFAIRQICMNEEAEVARCLHYV